MKPGIPISKPVHPRRRPPVRSPIGGCLVAGVIQLLARFPSTAATIAPEPTSILERFCTDCHGTDRRKGNLDLESLIGQDADRHASAWEKVIRKVASHHMPPAGHDKPGDAERKALLASLTTSLDAAAARSPDPGRTDTFRRLNRTEYRNAVRDLLDLDVDASTWLPKDEAGHGFDNVTVADLSPTLLDRYITAATRISRLALGLPENGGSMETYRVRPDITQEERLETLPHGTRGGIAIRHAFPREGEYEIHVRLARDRNEEIEGLHEPHEVEFLLDRERLALMTVAPPADRHFDAVDQGLKARFSATAGPHDVAVTFLKNPTSLPGTRRQPYHAHFNMHRHPRLTPAVYQVSIAGPFHASGPGSSPSRRRILACIPTGAGADDCARLSLETLMRRAYRRPPVGHDFERPMAAFRQRSQQDGFDAGLADALAAVLTHPEFLFRIERVPPGHAPETVYRLGPGSLASRLSFFLWSSLPDDALLDAAARGGLATPEGVEAQARRMLADPRASNLVSNFGSQWLHLRNLDACSPDARLFPDFDDNLRQAFRRETELLLADVFLGNRPVGELLRPGSTHLNERLARHYQIPHVHGSQFRRIDLSPETPRGGLLRHGSLLTVTSYATRTSPVLRGHWILANLMGCPPPPPPATVPPLRENTISDALPIRTRLSEHRANTACASCHELMDPVGFALEHFDAVGRWRPADDGFPIDASGGLPDGARFDGVRGLEAALQKQPEMLAQTLTEKLLVFALGRGLQPTDAPHVRQILRDTRPDNHRFWDLVLGIVRSVPFTHRKAP